jgi:hypothetical protein
VQEPLEKESFDEKALKVQRLIQIATLLPLTVITALMLYFKEASEFGVLAIFFLLILGVIVPQTRGDLILTRVALKAEVEERAQQLRQEMEALLDQRLSEKDTTHPGKQSHVFQRVP